LADQQDTTYTILDISKYQERHLGGDRWEIVTDFAAVQRAGVAGVIARVGDGLYLDPTWDEHVRRLLASGLMWGVYHFFRTGIDPVLQADFVAQHVHRLTRSRPSLGVWGDFEEEPPALGQQAHFTAIDSYLQRLDTAFALNTGLYSRASYLNQHFTRTQQIEWRGRPGWWAHYGVPNPLVPWGWQGKEWPYVLWQHGIGTIPGILNPVDLNRTYPNVAMAELFSRALAQQETDMALVDLLLMQDITPELANTIRQHMQDLAADVQNNGRCLPYGAPAPGPLYRAQVLYNCHLRDGTGAPATHPTLAPNGIVLTGTVVEVWEEGVVIGEFPNRVVIVPNRRLNIVAGTSGLGPSLRRL
jgi:GH25 family lysozyme M1 (1,4-beta-N-acetylmuramidase)